MANAPVVRISLKTKSSFGQFPDQYIDVCAMWDGEYGISGKFSDGSYVGGSGYGYRIDAILFAGGITAEPNNVWLNGKMTDDGVTLWVKSRNTKETANFITATEGEYGLRGQFAEGVTGVRFTAISDSGNEETFTVTPENVFINGRMTETVAATDAVTQTISADDVPF
jgi:hypothetical protein